MTTRNVLKARGMFALGAIAGLLLVAGCGGETTTKARRRLGPKDAQTIISESTPGVVEIYGKYNDEPVGGSGFIYDAGPPVRILTNSHVVEGLSSLQVKVGDQVPTVPAQVVAQAPCDDVAVLELPSPPPEVTALPLGDSDAVESGAVGGRDGLPGQFPEVQAADRELDRGHGVQPRSGRKPDQRGPAHLPGADPAHRCDEPGQQRWAAAQRPG